VNWRVELTRIAAKAYDRADGQLAQRLDAVFDELVADPFSGDAIPLKGRFEGAWRRRVGDWRVVYRIEGESRRVVVTLIAHRREAYR
jgi:mRNA interferase RelE/StbE